MSLGVQKRSNLLFPEHLYAYNTNIHIADIHMGDFQAEKTDKLPHKLPPSPSPAPAGQAKKRRGNTPSPLSESQY